MADVPSGKQPEPGPFARAVSDQIRLALTRHRVSGNQLAARIERSQSYMSVRLRNEASFTANDVDEICLALGEDLEGILRAAVRAARAEREAR